jgi:hypothetical protein
MLKVGLTSFVCVCGKNLAIFVKLQEPQVYANWK